MVSHAIQCLAVFQTHPCQQLIISSAGVWWSAQQAHPWLPWLARQQYCQYKAKFGTPSSCLERKTIISNTLLHKYLAYCAGNEPRAETNPSENWLQCKAYGTSKQDSWSSSAGQWFPWPRKRWLLHWHRPTSEHTLGEQPRYHKPGEEHETEYRNS